MALAVGEKNIEPNSPKQHLQAKPTHKQSYTLIKGWELIMGLQGILVSMPELGYWQRDLKASQSENKSLLVRPGLSYVLRSPVDCTSLQPCLCHPCITNTHLAAKRRTTVAFRTKAVFPRSLPHDPLGPKCIFPCSQRLCPHSTAKRIPTTAQQLRLCLYHNNKHFLGFKPQAHLPLIKASSQHSKVSLSAQHMGSVICLFCLLSHTQCCMVGPWGKSGEKQRSTIIQFRCVAHTGSGGGGLPLLSSAHSHSTAPPCTIPPQSAGLWLTLGHKGNKLVVIKKLLSLMSAREDSKWPRVLFRK